MLVKFWIGPSLGNDPSKSQNVIKKFFVVNFHTFISNLKGGLMAQCASPLKSASDEDASSAAERIIEVLI